MNTCLLAAAVTGGNLQVVLTVVAVASAITAVWKGRSDKDTADKADWREGTKNLLAAVQADAKTAREDAAAARVEAHDCRGLCVQLYEENNKLRVRVSHLEIENRGLRSAIDRLGGQT